MTETELRKAFDEQKAGLLAWGTVVRDRVATRIQSKLGERNLAEFLKIPPEPRVKQTESFLAKALRRGKDYKNPLEDITDKVGVRFVVLLKSDLRTVCSAIEECDLWEWQKDKDFESERAERPHHFDYQSDHYIVRAKGLPSNDNETISIGTPCEIQVRTLLQHAYAELAHDRTYKPSGTIDKEALRQVAKSAALVETTDEIFVAVNERLQSANQEIQRAHRLLSATFAAFVGCPGNDDIRLSNALLDCYREQLPVMTKENLDTFLVPNDFLAERIRERAPLSALYRHPSVLAVYFFVANEPDLVPSRWPFDMKHLEMIYADLGVSAEGRLF